MITNSKSVSLVRLKHTHNDLFEPVLRAFKKMYKTTKTHWTRSKAIDIRAAWSGVAQR